MADQKKWLIKDVSGHIYGPVAHSRMFDLIDRTVLLGQEDICEFPGGDWEKLSRHPEFYDRLLSVLQSEAGVLSEAERSKELSRQTKEEDNFNDGIRTRKVEPPPRLKETVAEDPTQHRRGKVHRERKLTLQKPILENPPPQKNYAEEEDRFAVIDLKPKTQLIKKKKKEQSLLPLIIFLVIAGAAYYLLFETKPQKPIDDRAVHLVLPKKSGAAKPLEGTIEENIKKAWTLFHRDSFKDYLRLQNYLVVLIEAQPSKPELLSLMCLTYRELWPYTFQDSADLSAFSQVAQWASLADPLGEHDNLCRISQKLVEGHSESAHSQIRTALNDFPASPILYEMKAQILAESKDYGTAVSYVQKTQQLMPQWVKPFVLEAKYRFRYGQYPEAKRSYEAVLARNQNHAIAQVELGVLEGLLNQDARATELIQSGFASDKVPKQVKSQGFAYLAKSFARRQKQQRALEFAVLAYQNDPTNFEMKEFVEKYGSADLIKPLKTECQEVISLGDQYIKKGNYIAAQAEYRSALEICNPPSAKAALRAGESLWKLNQAPDAIQMVQKAVSIDPKYVEAYVTLADFQSHRFDFVAALAALKQAQKISKNSFEVFRGYANLEFRRKNFRDAIKFGQQAMKLYDTDIETHLVLIRAHQALKEYREAYQVAARAIEIDKHNVKAQALYSEVMAGFQGVGSAADYLKGLINTYPSEYEYRFSYGNIMALDEKFPEAIDSYNNAIQINPYSKEAFIKLGEIHFSANHPQEALKAYLSAAGLDPSDAYPLYVIGTLYLQTQNSLAAVKYFEKALKINDRYPGAHQMIGRAAFLAGDYDRALKEVELEKRANPRVADAYILAGEIYIRKNLFSKAVEELQKAVKLRSQSAETYILMGRAYRLSGNFEIAMTMLNIAVAKESGNAEIYKELGATYEKKRQMEQAVTAYNRYLELSPNAMDSQIIQQRIQSLEGQ